MIGLPYTLLSIGRYGKVMGINPAHLMGASAMSLSPAIMPITGCTSVWHKYSWQTSDGVSLEDLTLAIKTAEEDIARVVNFWPAPMWIAEEPHVYERPYLREAYGIDGGDVRYKPKVVQADFGKFVEAGRRLVTLIGTATVAGATLVYTDADSDGFYETATITLSTTLTDMNQVKVYHAGHSGDPDWEIAPVRSKTKVGANVVIVLYSWQLISPALYEEFPSSDEPIQNPIDISATTNFVTSVDVYRERTDFSQASAQFLWENQSAVLDALTCVPCGSTDEAACDYTSQDGCLHARNPALGTLVPMPAEYDSDNAVWDQVAFSVCHEPDLVKLWYRAGAVDEKYTRGFSYDPLSDFWAQIIAYLATSRLEHVPCGCPNVKQVFENLSVDTAFNSPNSGSYFLPERVQDNPFGTRKGEIWAWRRIAKVVQRIPNVALI